MNRKTFKILLWAATAFFALVAVALLVVAIAWVPLMFFKVMMIIIAVICLLLAVEIGYFALLTSDSKPNYFLYNSQTKRNISVQKLTFEAVDARMNKFLGRYAASEGAVWNDRILDNPYLEIPVEFAPLVAYKLLYGLAERDSEAGWKILANASDDTVKYICKAIGHANDTVFANTISAKMAEKPVNMKLIRDYLVKNKRYIKARMMKYVIDNIEKF